MKTPYTPDITNLLMPVGANRDRPINKLSTRHLTWILTKDSFCARYPRVARAAVVELRKRFQEPGRIEAELLADEVSDLL